MSQFIGIEAGGTKFVLTYGSGPNDLHERTVIPTDHPRITMHEIFKYIRSIQKHTEISAIGAAVFGPLDPDPLSDTYGHITTSPKLDWVNYDFVGTLKNEFNLPVGFDTDVNTAAVGERRWGAAQGLSDFIYITVGTGIGAGAIVGGNILHGAMHAEMGHILIPQNTNDPFTGVCPYHTNCLEGLASGPSLNKRWQVKSALEIPNDHNAWNIEADYLATAVATYTLCLSPKRIIMGGGVMRQPYLLEKIRPKVIEKLGGYIKNNTVIAGIEEYIVPPGLGENSGICGALALAEEANNQNMENLCQQTKSGLFTRAPGETTEHSS